MLVKEISYKSRRRGANVRNLSSNMGSGWSAPIEFPVPVRINNVLCTHFNISEYGAIRFTQVASDGKYHYWGEDSKLPVDISETDKGYMLVPWGAPMKVRGCGVSVEMWEDNGVVVINYKTKSIYNSKNVYMYRVEFDARDANVVRVFYYHCVSGYDTYVGAVLEPDDYVTWDLKEMQPYMKKALEFVIEDEVSYVEPVKIEHKETDWTTVYETATLKVLTK